MGQEDMGGSFSRCQLKLLIAVTMVADHVGYMLVPVPQEPSDLGMIFCWLLYYVLRLVGRLTYPLVCFFLLQGMHHTHDRKKYLLRIFLFALFSEIPFDLAINGRLVDWTGQNVLFTLFIGLVMLYLLERIQRTKTLSVRVSASVLTVLGAMLLAYILKTDYSYWGILLLLIFYIENLQKRQKFWTMLLLCASANIVQMFAVTSLFFIERYDADKNKGQPLFGRYFFYLFYPFHLLVLLGIKQLLAITI